jgi:hypothetical protein
MKSRFPSVAVAAAIVTVTLAGCSSADYGKPITLSESTRVSAILADPDAFDGKLVLVEGEITEVCEMMGCWIMVRDGDDLIRFKVDDGVIEFPMEAKGRMVRAEGIVSVKELTVEQQITEGEHHADESGTTFDPATVTGPARRVQIEGQGARVI